MIGRTLFAIACAGCLCRGLFAQSPAPPPSSPAASPGAAEIGPGAADEAYFKEMGAALGKMKTLSACFVQKRRLALFDDLLISEGTFHFAPPGRLRWQISKPYSSALLVRDGRAAKFEPASDGQLRRLEMGGAEILAQVLEQIMVVLRGDFAALGKTYVIRRESNATGQWVVLVPKSSALQQYLRGMRLLVTPGSYRVTRVVLLEGGGDEVTLEFSKIEENRPLDDRLFDLVKPLP